MGLIADYMRSRSALNDQRRLALKAQTDMFSGQIPQWEMITGKGHKPKHNPVELVQNYRAWAYTCANKNAAGVAKATLRLYATRGTGEGRSRQKAHTVSRKQLNHLSKLKYVAESPRFKAAQEIEEIETHPFLTLMQNMNPFHNQFDMMETLSIYMDCSGQNFWYIKPGPLGVPEEIWTLPAQYTRVVPDEKDFISGYLYVQNPSKPVAYTPDEVIWFPRPNPQDPWNGMGRIEGAYWAIKGYTSMEQYELYQTENHGIKDFLVNYKTGKINPKQRRDLMMSWSAALDMAAKRRTPLIADMDFDIKDAAWSPKEMGFLNGRQWRKEEIINAFGQHSAMYDKNANTANIQGAIYLWEEFEITSTLIRIAQKLNEQLIPKYGEPRLFVAFDAVVDSDKEQDRANADMLLKHGYPLNKILESMGLDPVEGGDQGYITGMVTPLGGLPSTQDGGPSNTDARAASQANTKSKTPTGGASHVLLLKAGDEPEVDVELTGGPNAPLTARQKKIAKVKQVWQAQVVLALAEVPKLEAADFAWVASDEWAQEIIDLTSGAMGEFMEIGAKEGAEQIGVQLIDFIEQPGAQDAIRAHNFEFAQRVNQSTADSFKKQMAIGLEKGESIPEITKRIEAMGTEWQGYRAERVARTESARALMTGREEQWRQSGVVGAKVWDANGDACPFCLDMDGKIVEIGVPYFGEGVTQSVDFKGREIKLNHNYGVVNGPPLHLNCRCSLQPQLIDVEE